MTVSVTPQLPGLDTAAIGSLAVLARQALSAAADGNGLQAAQVRLSREELVTHRLTAEISVTFSHKIQQAPAVVAPPGAVLMADEQAARDAAGLHETTLSQDTALAALIDRELRKQPGQGFGIGDLRFSLGPAAEKIFFVAGTAGNSGIAFTARYTAEARFTLWRQGADVAALAAAEKLGLARLADTDLADVFITPLRPDAARLKADCVLFLPVAKIEFSLEGRFIPAIAAGRGGEIVDMEPVLDRWLKPGVSALLKLSRGPLAVESLATTALKFRLVRQTLQGLLYHSRRDVYQQAVRDYPLGVSDKYLRACVKYAAGALPAFSRDARRQSLLLAAAATLVFAGIYFGLNLRGMLLGGLGIADTLPLFALDLLLWFLLGLGGFALIRFNAGRSLQRRLQTTEKLRQWPPAETEGRRVFIWTGIIMLMAAFILPGRPQWAATLWSFAHGHLAPIFPILIS